MILENIVTGVDFEQYIKGLFEQNGITTSDTPASNDYGADLFFEYKGYRVVVQCKYYSKAVGVKAVQEVTGALSFYNAHFSIVITNSAFTQQAANLASLSHTLLISGEELDVFFNNEKFISLLNDLIKNCSSSQGVIRAAQEDWVMNDLVIRYGVSKDKIMKDFIARGLPYYRVGREYHFEGERVKNWEIAVQSIPYRTKGTIQLPAFIAYRQNILKELAEARRSKDRKVIKDIKAVMKKQNIRKESNVTSIFAIILIILTWGAVLYFVFKWMGIIQ